ncbi:hypothetical protein PROFUN_17103, partial [Planoprotostelium fungivorum]
MKLECELKEAIFVKPKTYSYVKKDGKEDVRNKGVVLSQNKEILIFDSYKRAVFSDDLIMAKNTLIRKTICNDILSMNTMTVDKAALDGWTCETSLRPSNSMLYIMSPACLVASCWTITPYLLDETLRDISKTHYQGANKRGVILSCRSLEESGSKSKYWAWSAQDIPPVYTGSTEDTHGFSISFWHVTDELWLYVIIQMSSQCWSQRTAANVQILVFRREYKLDGTTKNTHRSA